MISKSLIEFNDRLVDPKIEKETNNGTDANDASSAYPQPPLLQTPQPMTNQRSTLLPEIRRESWRINL